MRCTALACVLAILLPGAGAFMTAGAFAVSDSRSITLRACLSKHEAAGFDHAIVASSGATYQPVTRRLLLAGMAAGLLSPAAASAQQTNIKEDGAKKQNDAQSKVRIASSGKTVLRDEFCPEPRSGQAILLNCQKAKIKRAKLAKQGKGTDNASAKDASAQTK
mmetsp:Transcript_81094/g.118759  ORF Transcript_81094/g.118759 Transcript_81094/m.118759 type:complete len:163 (+) Transcript_81094:18-506(+)